VLQKCFPSAVGRAARRPRQRVPCVQRDGAAQQVQGVGGAAQRVQRHAQVAVQHRAAAVDAQRVPEVVLRQLELLLPVVHRAQAVPAGGGGRGYGSDWGLGGERFAVWSLGFKAWGLGFMCLRFRI